MARHRFLSVVDSVQEVARAGLPGRRGALRRSAWLLLASWCALLVALTYGRSLTLPFFFDDLLQIPFAAQSSLRSLWLPDAGVPYAYYRPLTLTLWKLGGYNAWLQHLVNLVLHALNGLLVGWLAWRLWPRSSTNRTITRGRHPLLVWVRPLLSATFFLLFPFSYQAVPFVGAVTQILVTTLVLLALAAYLQAQSSGRRSWALFSLLCTALAPFAHENGVLVGPLLIVILLGRPIRLRRTALIRDGLLWTLPALFWLPLWWLAPKGVDDGVALNGAEAIGQNALYFLQGLAYPLTWLGSRLRAWGINDLLALTLLTAVALALALFVQRRRTGPRRWLPWLWCALAMMPAVLFLPFDYVINGPRLLMLFSVGVAWLWADVAGSLLQRAWPAPASSAAIMLAILLLLAQNLFYLESRMEAHRMLGEAFEEATRLTRAANEAGVPAIFVNFPSWLAPEATYAVGHEGVLFWPDYVAQESLVSAQSGRPAQLHLVQHDATRPQAPYHYGIAGGGADWTALSASGGRVFVADYEEEQIPLRLAGSFSQAAPAAPPLAHFQDHSGAVALLGTRLERSAGSPMRLHLNWRADAPPPEDVTIFVHLVDASGQLLAQNDGHPLAGVYPLAEWPATQIIEDVRLLPAAESGAALRVGLYHRNSGQRLRATSPEGQPLPDDAFTILIRR